jgi:amyloid beta precursor protein binding protein 1
MDTAENNQIHEDEAQTGPSKKDTKYDRQLRLWGVAGQKSLSEAHVLLVNAG